MKKLDIALNIILITMILAAILLIVMTGAACKKAARMCDDEWDTHAKNSAVFLPYTDSFGNPTSTKPLELCKEGK